MEAVVFFVDDVTVFFVVVEPFVLDEVEVDDFEAEAVLVEVLEDLSDDRLVAVCWSEVEGCAAASVLVSDFSSAGWSLDTEAVFAVCPSESEAKDGEGRRTVLRGLVLPSAKAFLPL